jgi:choline dehydrogenase-like flavoprotein
MPEHYDVTIIGTGAGGGTLAHTLAPSGKKILSLERGDVLPRGSAEDLPTPENRVTLDVVGTFTSPTRRPTKKQAASTTSSKGS